MDQEAIQRIEQLTNGCRNVEFDQPAVALPGDMRLHNLERFRDTPIRQRATFTTQQVTDFINYVKPDAGDATAVFVAADGTLATAVIDYGTHEAPQWKDHTAVLKSQATPAFDALRQLTNGPKSQRNITDWIEDWRDIVEACDENGSEIPLGQAIAAVRRVDIKRQRHTTSTDADMEGSVNTLDSISASSGDQKLPAFFRVTTPMFEDLSNIEFRVRLALRTSDDTPAFGLRIVALEQIKRAVAGEIEKRVRDGLSGVRVFVGRAEAEND